MCSVLIMYSYTFYQVERTAIYPTFPVYLRYIFFYFQLVGIKNQPTLLSQPFPLIPLPPLSLYISLRPVPLNLPLDLSIALSPSLIIYISLSLSSYLSLSVLSIYIFPSLSLSCSLSLSFLLSLTFSIVYLFLSVSLQHVGNGSSQIVIVCILSKKERFTSVSKNTQYVTLNNKKKKKTNVF